MLAGETDMGVFRWTAALVLIIAASARAGGPATLPTTRPVPFEVHSGYFVSNQFDPKAAVSFVVIQERAVFDRVFGVAWVIHQSAHLLPNDAFQTKMVVGVIKRGKAIWKFTVEGVEAGDRTLIVRYRTRAVPNQSATFAVPLILSLDKGNYTAVQFVANGKLVKTLALQGPVENLVTRLSADPVWMNGTVVYINLPPTTATEALVSQALDRASPDQEPAGHHILKTTDVRIQGKAYTAILVQTHRGEKIVLVKYMGVKSGWWSRVYDAERSEIASDTGQE